MFRSPVEGIRRIRETLALSTLSQVWTFRWTEKGPLARPGVSTSSDLTLASGRAVGVSSVVFGLRLRVKLWDALLRRFQMYGREWTLLPRNTSLVPSPSTIISTVITIITVITVITIITTITVNRFVVRTQAGRLGVTAACGADRGTASARRRRERRQRSWWRHEQLSVAQKEVVTRQEGREVEVQDVYYAPQVTKATSPRDAAGTSGGVPRLHMTTTTLLSEQEAKEVQELEAKLAGKEQWLMTHIEHMHSSDLHVTSRLEKGVIRWFMIKREVMTKKGEKRKRKKKKRKVPKTSSSLSSRRAVLEQVADVPVVVQRPIPMVQSVHLPVVSTVAVHRKGPRCHRCVLVSPEEYKVADFSGRGLLDGSVLSTLIGSTVDTFSCFSVYSAMLGLLWYMQSVSHAGNLDEFPTVSYVKDPEVDSRPTPRTVTSLLSLVVPRCRASTGVLWRCSVPSPIRVSSACAGRLWYRRRCRCWCGLRVDTACVSRELHAVHWHVGLSGR